MKQIQNKSRFLIHNFDIICVLYGSLLTGGLAEKRFNSTRFILQYESSNMEYLMWYYSFFSERGYMSTKKPSVKIRIGKNSKVRFFCQLRTWSFSSLNWIYESFYTDGQKKIPQNLENFFGPRTIAILVQEKSSFFPFGLKIVIDYYKFEDVRFLCQLFEKKYGILATPNKDRKRWYICIPKQSIPILANLIKDHVVPSVFYKFNRYLPIVTNI